MKKLRHNIFPTACLVVLVAATQGRADDNPFEQTRRTEARIKQVHDDRVAMTEAELKVFAANIVKGGKPDAAYESLRVIAEVKLPEAVEPLLDHIEWADVLANWFHSKLGEYPVPPTLIAIGMPSVNAIGKRLPSEADPLRAALMCRVIQEVLGKELGTAFIDELSAKETDPKNRERLANARKRVTSEITSEPALNK
jgi:hypothetical protein